MIASIAQRRGTVSSRATHRLLSLTLLTIGFLIGASCHSYSSTPGSRDDSSPVSRWPYLSSEELVRAGEPDTIYIRRVRAFEQLVRQVRTDSLAKLYVGSLDAAPEKGRVYLQAVSCQYSILLRRYGDAPTARALQLMTDSLFATPAARRRWLAAQDRWPTSRGDDYRCDLSGIPVAPDSLSWRPYKERAP
jgi:hypothetical protein